MQLVVTCRIGALQATHHAHAHTAGKEGVFAISFLSPAPARVAENVDVRSPESKPLIALQPAILRKTGALGPGLIAHSRKHLVQQAVIERSSHADRLRENRSQPGTPHTVQSLVPPVILFDAQPGNGRRGVLHQRSLFLERKTAHQVAGTFGCRQRRVLIRQPPVARQKEGANHACPNPELNNPFHRFYFINIMSI